MKKIITALAIFGSTMAFSQVGIGTNTPSTKSILDLTATDKGFLLPRMTTAQRTAITPNATTDKSMQVFDTTTNTIWFWNGNVWVEQKDTNTTYTGSASVALNGTSFERVALSGDVTATQNSNNVTINIGAVTSAKIEDGTIVNADLDNGVGGIYKGSGTLSEDTEVTQGSFYLDFITNIVSGFTVDGLTFTVDGLNNRVGIGEVPTNKLHVKDAANPLRLEGLQNAAIADQILTTDINGVVRKNTIDNILSQKSVPTICAFELTSNITSFLNGVGAGGNQTVNMALVKNQIPGLTYNSTTSTITFPAGLYQFSFTYEADHNATGCTISSYIVDFPDGLGNKRIHQTASHNQGGASNHGGTITFTSQLPARTWTIQFGRGQSGNCTGTGNTLFGPNTQLNILRMGD